MKSIYGSITLVALACALPAQAQTATPQDGAAAAGSAVQAVVVTATTPPTQSLIDRKVYSVAGDLQATAGSAADVLNKVPSVAVDADGNVSLRGDGNVTILVDGKPSAQFSGPARGASLLQFPASDIERIEALTNPPAQYKAEGSGGVINIITKKSRKQGFSGVEQASLGNAGRYVIGLDGSYNKGDLKLTGGLGLRRDIRERRTDDSRTTLDPVSQTIVASRQDIDEHFRRLIPQVKAGVDYALNDRQSIGASYNRRELTGKRFFDQHNESGAPLGPVNRVSDRHSDGHEWSIDAGQNLHFEQKLSRPDETLNIALQRSVTREREGYVYRNLFTLPPAAPAFDDLHLSLDLVKTELSVDYDLPLPNDREIRFGYDLEDDRNAFDNVGDDRDPATGERVLNTAVTNHFRYQQRVNALYGQYAAPLGAWKLQTGLRLEQTEVSTLQITGNIPGGTSFFGAYPSLSLDRGLGDAGKLSASLGRRVTRPDPESLNPFSDHQDTHNLRAGNPNLLPQDTWSFELGYGGKLKSLSYGATGYVHFDRNSVTDVLQPVSADVVLATKANLPRSRSGGVEFTGSGKLYRQLSYNFSGNLFLTQIDATALGAPGTKSTSGLNLKASLDYRPTGADMLQLSFTRADKRLTPQGSLSATNLVNLGYKRQFRPELALVVTATDVFDGQKQRRLVDTPQLHDEYLRHQLGKIVYLGLTYTFGASKAGRGEGFEYEP